MEKDKKKPLSKGLGAEVSRQRKQLVQTFQGETSVPSWRDTRLEHSGAWKSWKLRSERWAGAI